MNRTLVGMILVSAISACTPPLSIPDPMTGGGTASGGSGGTGGANGGGNATGGGTSGAGGGGGSNSLSGPEAFPVLHARTLAGKAPDGGVDLRFMQVSMASVPGVDVCQTLTSVPEVLSEISCLG